MALKYYPLSRIIPNKDTRGNEYTLPDGTPYTGKYYITYDNRFFTGINTVFSTGEELIPILGGEGKVRGRSTSISNPYNRGTANTPSTTVYDSATGQYAGELLQLAPYYPIPIPSDYDRGYFTRYFAKNISGPGYVIEISEQDWNQVKNGSVNKGLLSYEIMDMLWQLTGPTYDTRKSQYQIIGGVLTTNKRVTEAKQASFRGIVEFIGGEYTKFAQITDMSVATSGSI